MTKANFTFSLHFSLDLEVIYLLDEVQEVKVSKHAYTYQWCEQWHLLKTTIYQFVWLIISAIKKDSILDAAIQCKVA